jgi:hypothetical protein
MDDPEHAALTYNFNHPGVRAPGFSNYPMTTQQTLIEKYGEPSLAYQEKFCAVWEIRNDFAWFPVEKFLVNTDFKAKLFVAFTNLVKANLHTEITEFSGCYNDREVRGMNSTSLHAWAAAIDLNAAENPMLVKPVLDITVADRCGKWSGQFIAIMKAAGLFYGGDFHFRPDPMHFGSLNG